MDICRRKDGLEISELDPFLAELLRQIPAGTSIDNCPAAQNRIYSQPADASQKEMCAEWKLYVQPELQRLFRSATETVMSDLEQLNGNEKPFANRKLFIPTKHADAWLNALNQARLSIAARNDFTDGELGDNYRSPIGSRRDLSLFQVNFYGFLQEFILRELVDWSGNSPD
jgi:hypothetical protein